MTILEPNVSVVNACAFFTPANNACFPSARRTNQFGDADVLERSRPGIARGNLHGHVLPCIAKIITNIQFQLLFLSLGEPKPAQIDAPLLIVVIQLVIQQIITSQETHIDRHRAALVALQDDLFFLIIHRRQHRAQNLFAIDRLETLRRDGQAADAQGDDVLAVRQRDGGFLTVKGERQLTVGVNGQRFPREQGIAVAERLILGDVQIGPLARPDDAHLAPRGGQEARRVAAGVARVYRHVLPGGDFAGDRLRAGIDRVADLDLPVFGGIRAGDGHRARVAAAGIRDGEVRCTDILRGAVERQVLQAIKRSHVDIHAQLVVVVSTQRHGQEDLTFRQLEPVSIHAYFSSEALDNSGYVEHELI